MMLKLKNVSKYYYNKGVIASGFTKVNIEFDIGEFVAIIGESGSGKSTLLNVISGLDSYEEGEMYINGEETSHYREVDFENYRKKYVSNIFQNFNLVNSYSVYQNVELVLLLNGYKKSEVKEKVLNLIKQVGLKKYKNTKVSKLSGGQKQRVAIARALARETPIIVCDEPTANLDSKSSKEIINLLKEISKDKLVIVVTHNYQEIENLCTRVVKMHDGKIISDKQNKEVKIKDNVIINNPKNIGIFNMTRLGFRNTFNIIPKFILIFLVFFFVTISLLTVYASLKKSEYEESKIGENYYFSDTSDNRIVIKKKDGKVISDSDVDNIKNINNVSYVVYNDILLDEYLWFDDKNYEFSFSGKLQDIELLDKEITYGRMPKEDDEVVVMVYKNDYYFSKRRDEAIDKYYYYTGDLNSIKVKIVGIVLVDNIYDNSVMYGSKELIKKYMIIVNRNYSNMSININNKNYDSYFVVATDNVSSGNVYISEGLNYLCKDYNCKNKYLSINVDNLYYKDSINLKISNLYNEKNIKNLLGLSKEEATNGYIYINKSDYNKLFSRESYQPSVFVNKIDGIDDVELKLKDLGYETLQIRKTFSNMSDSVKILKIVKLVVITCMVFTLFFISYFVIKLILKSRNVYFSTLRILGGNRKHVKRILDIELFINSSLAYISYLILIILVNKKVIEIGIVSSSLEYLKIFDYVIMYIILIIMSYLVSSRFAYKLFNKSAMKVYREEV